MSELCIADGFATLRDDEMLDIVGGINWFKVGVVAAFAIGACAIGASAGVAVMVGLVGKATVVAKIATTVVGVCAGVAGFAEGVNIGNTVYNTYLG